MSDAYSIMEGHVDEAGRKRRSKKDDIRQLTLFGNSSDHVTHIIATTPMSNTAPEWAEINVEIERTETGCKVVLTIMDEHGFEFEHEDFIPSRGAVGALLHSSHVLPRHWQ